MEVDTKGDTTLSKNCIASSCGGKTVQTENLFLHTLGNNPKIEPDFSRFIECQVWLCTKCGHIQLYSTGAEIKVPSER